MSVACEINGCAYEATSECTCEKKISVCQKHQISHFKECGKPFMPLELTLKEQRERKASADKKLLLLRSMAISQAEGIIKAVREALSSFLDSIDSEKMVLAKMRYGRGWDEAIIQSIETSGFSETNLLKFKNLLKEMQAIKNTILSDEKNKQPDNDQRKNGVMVPAGFKEFNYGDKLKCLAELGLDLPPAIQEIKVSNDGNIAFICIWYSDCKNYLGIWYADSYIYLGNCYAVGKKYSGI